MTVSIIQAQYDTLEEVAKRFEYQANDIDQLTNRLIQSMDQLESGGWKGVGSQAFFQEMHGTVFPALSRLHDAFNHSSNTTRFVAKLIAEAEQEAANLFKTNDAIPSNQSTNDTTSSTNSIDERNQELNKQLQEFVDNREEYPDTVPWPTGFPANQFTDPIQMSEREAEILGNWNLLRFRKMDQLQNEAFSAEEAVYGFDENGENNNNGIPDAFRHAYWSARMAQEFGAEWATDYTNAHEEKAGNTGSMDFMDRHNNAIGIRIAQENPDASPEELARLIVTAVENGETIYIPDGSPNGSIAYTNTDPNPLPHTPNDDIDIPVAS